MQGFAFFTELCLNCLQRFQEKRTHIHTHPPPSSKKAPPDTLTQRPSGVPPEALTATPSRRPCRQSLRQWHRLPCRPHCGRRHKASRWRCWRRRSWWRRVLGRDSLVRGHCPLSSKASRPKPLQMPDWSIVAPCIPTLARPTGPLGRGSSLPRQTPRPTGVAPELSPSPPGDGSDGWGVSRSGKGDGWGGLT